MYGNFTEVVSSDLDELIERLSQLTWPIPEIDLDLLQDKDIYRYSYGIDHRIAEEFDQQQWRTMISEQSI